MQNRLNFKNWPIGTKFTILFLIAILLPVIIVGVPAASQRVSALRDENRSRLNTLGPYEINRADQTLVNTAVELERIISTYLDTDHVEEYLYRAPTALSDQEREQLERDMLVRQIRVQANAVSVSRIRFYDRTLTLLRDTGEETGQTGATPANQMLEAEQVQTKFVISDIYADAEGNPSLDIVFRFPLDNPNYVIGYVVFTQNLMWAEADTILPDLYATLHDFPQSEWPTHVFMLNEAGQLISTTPELTLFDDFSTTGGLRIAQQGQGGVSDYHSTLLNADVLGYHQTVPISDGPTITFLIETPTSSINEEAFKQVMFTLVPIVLGSVILAVGVAVVANIMIVRPLARLTDAAQKISAKQWDVSLPVLTREDEIGVLNNSFRDMTNQLVDLIDTLEDRVKERTYELEIARNDAEKANRVKSQFLANMSHELRTPLNAILNFSSFVAQGFMGPVTDDQVQALDTVMSSGNHLLNLINDVLDIAKIEVGKMDLFVEGVDLNKELKGVISVTYGLIQDKPIDLVIEIEPDLPFIQGDSRRLHQVFLNLLSNAVKFTPEGNITFSARRSGSNILLAVRDNGVGIAPEDQALVFEAFEQAEHGMRQGNAGTGLGLPISKHFVEAHGGRMWLESELGKGSTFYVALPINAKPGDKTDQDRQTE